jgi:hypothetical protein
MDRRYLENVIPQVGRCGIWCGSCVVGNGALMGLAQRYREMVQAHGLKEWGAAGFDYGEFIKGLECVAKLHICPGCLSGGGRDDCPLRQCVHQHELDSCVECGEFSDCEHAVLLEYMRSGARRAGLTVIDAPADSERLRAAAESALTDRWWWRALFADAGNGDDTPPHRDVVEPRTR